MSAAQQVQCAGEGRLKSPALLAPRPHSRLRYFEIEVSRRGYYMTTMSAVLPFLSEPKPRADSRPMGGDCGSTCNEPTRSAIQQDCAAGDRVQELR